LKTFSSLLILPVAFIIALDQISKFLVANTVGVHQKINVIGGFLNIVHVRNRGMAFGLLNRPGAEAGSYFLILATLIAVALMLFWFVRLRNVDSKTTLALSFIIGGAIGNLVDRVRLKEVVDFLDFHVGSYHWPAFNLADSAITIGTIWLLIRIIFQASPKEKTR